MSHKKIVVSIFLSLFCFLGSMTSAWADNGESKHRYRVTDEVPADAYEGEYVPENGYAAQEYYQEDQGYYPENQEYYPENQGDQVYYPENQGYYPENQGYYPEDQGHYPEDQGYYPEDQGYYPENQGDQGYYPENQGNFHEEVPENESLYVGERPWQKGFDARLHVGLLGFFTETKLGGIVGIFWGDKVKPQVNNAFGGHFAGEIGYRWKYGGIYLKLGVSPLYYFEEEEDVSNDNGTTDNNGTTGDSGTTDNNGTTDDSGTTQEESNLNPWIEINALAKFYIPLVKNWELVLDLGVGLGVGSGMFNIYVGAGANYHIFEHMTLGFEVTYQRTVTSVNAGFFSVNFTANLIEGTFVLGYTF